MIESHEAALKFFVADQQLAEAVEPAVGDLDYPTASTLFWIPFEPLGFLPPPLHMRNVTTGQDAFSCFHPYVTGVGAQVLRAPLRRVPAFDLNGIQNRIHLSDVMALRTGDDER